jgi:hypothetical protein
MFSVTVTGTTAGAKQNLTLAVTSNESAPGGPGGTATASLIVVAPPTIEKSFGAAEIFLNGTTSLTFTLTNPNTGLALTGVGFTDTLPAGLAMATPNGLSGSCGGGTITATAGTQGIGLAGATLDVGSSCEFAVNVLAVTTGVQVNNSSTVSSSNGGVGNAATASITIRALVPAAAAIPTLSTSALAVLALVLVLAGLSRRRSTGARDP